MKKLLAFMIMLVSVICLAACDESQEPTPDTNQNETNDNQDNTNQSDSTNDNQNDTNQSGSNNNEPEEEEEETEVPFVNPDAETTIFLAGDSTVKTYNDSQYIAGWGQYLDLFLDDNITVKNCAQGGRSSRSFINEGRLYDIAGGNYTFSENGGNSIGDEIKAGDYLFIQFGHNDDDTKMESSASSNYTNLYNRMVPLGTPNSKGIYPTTAGERTATTTLPTEYTQYATDSEETSALKEIAKYGSTYYAYGSGTYKWYLKQYIDFAREKGATPVLITPVARVKFSGSQIIGGPGLHGDDFAYVKAVRQLAEEEDCLLIDLFASTKELLEEATSTYANYLMALKPNELDNGTWPTGYDGAYGNTKAGYTGIEATHYNKYGAYLTAAYLAEALLNSIENKESHNSNKESYKFVNSVLKTPEDYIDPSNLITIAKIDALEALIEKVDVTNPDRAFNDEKAAIAAINELIAVEITNDNYLARQTEAIKVRAIYDAVNATYRSLITNYQSLVEYEATIEQTIIANRPVPTSVVRMNPQGLTAGELSSNQTLGIFTIYSDSATDKEVTVKSSSTKYTYNSEEYTVSQYLSMGGTATYGTGRYISFTTTGKCSVTIVAKSSNNTDNRVVKMVDSTNTKNEVATFEANTAISITTNEIEGVGTYYVGSSSGGVYIYDIIIEYFE
ncbi:MAG: rhamnogalacturonan acetylesterase [Erysipelotrichaceae bacterium]|nr:rhamnogalacturonan acetylesterase [Erysipelotrichaceae bacterium]